MRTSGLSTFCAGLVLVFAVTPTAWTSTPAAPLSADAEPLVAVIGLDANRQNIVADTFWFDTRYGQVHRFTPHKDGKYVIVVESSDAPLVLWLSKGDTPVSAAKESPEGQFKYSLD